MIRDYIYFMFVLIIALVMTVSRAARPDQLSDCVRTLKLCDAALTAAQEEALSLANTVRLQDGYITDLKKAALDNQSILPWFGWTLIGAGAAAVTIEAIK